MRVLFDLEHFLPTHPGEIIKDEIEYRGISQRALAMQTRYDIITARQNKVFSQKLNSIRININQGNTHCQIQ